MCMVYMVIGEIHFEGVRLLETAQGLYLFIVNTSFEGEKTDEH